MARRPFWPLAAALLAAAPAAAEVGAAAPDVGSAALRSVAALAAVVALVLLLSVVARRWLARVPAASGRHPIRVLASRPLGGRATLTLVEVEGERILVGGGPQGLSL
ncbi:MAG: hypothetical protein D6739_02130, partial [Nitrospirae bacterium]